MSSRFTGIPSAKLVQSAVCKTNIRHRPNPSLFIFPGLHSQPIYQSTLFPFTSIIESNFSVIKQEYESLRKLEPTSDFNIKQSNETEHKLHSGQWDWNSYILKGVRQSSFASKCPKTVELLESLDSPKLMVNTPFSFAFFSTLHKNSNISSHYGPCNLRIRCHLPLVVPDGDCGMEVGGIKIKWEVGKPLFFDDCYEHRGYYYYYYYC
jgi:aspartate beta-hydroxylase